MLALIAPFNRLALALAGAPGYLREVLSPVAESDEFLRRLLQLMQPREQHLELAITRNDFFLARSLSPMESAKDNVPPVLRPLQVELNTVAASYPGLSGIVAQLHAQLYRGTGTAVDLPPNDPLSGIAHAVLLAWERYGDPRATVVMVVQPEERNIFDQRLLEFRLQEHGLTVLRRSLEQIGEDGILREGHLWLAGKPVAVCYFRAGYGPEDYLTETAWVARKRIEQSDTIPVPTVAMQLGGSKKVQQVLAHPGELERFHELGTAQQLREAFAGLWDPEDVIAGTAGAGKAAWEVAVAYPDRFVLKPQREGGGHNLFDDQLLEVLKDSCPQERARYIIMERLRPRPYRGLLVCRGQLRDVAVVSEIGRYGVVLAEAGEVFLEQDTGCLVRTKEVTSLEGGVSAGFGFLSSLLPIPDEAPSI